MSDEKGRVVDPLKMAQRASNSDLWDMLHEVRMITLHLRGAIISVLEEDTSKSLGALDQVGEHLDKLDNQMAALIFKEAADG
jgi:hypothetical protein